MILTNKLYYILRVGDFATNANTKIYYSMFSCLLCLDDYITQNSTDCFIIMIYSTFIWTFIEFLLHITKTRVIQPMFLYSYNHRYKLPNYFGLFLQGFQEGGCITTIGLYFGDRIFDFNSLIFLHILIIFIVCNVYFKHRVNNCTSKRLVNSFGSLSLMSLITLYNFKTFYLYPIHSFRQLKMLFIMIYVSSFWTLIVWYKGFRTIEVYIQDKQNYEIIIRKNGLNTFYILSYDVIFEIGMAYLFFYNILIH
tara:strand:+ start:5276 stop:6031 length:756 start_codon:yes stop_codon:yes gene_type:complete